MSITAAQLEVKVSGNTKDAEDALDRLSKKTNDSSGFFKNLLGTAVGAFTGMLGAKGVTDAFGFLKDQLVDTVKAGMDAQQAQAQLAQGLKSTHDASGETTQGLDELAEKYSKLTTFSKTAIEQSEGISLTFTNIGKGIFPQATMAAEDLATRMGESLPSATLQLDKALGDPIKGYAQLQRVGVVFTQSQVDQIKAMSKAGDVAGAQKIILGELSKEFGGSAQAAGKTFAGQLQILQNQLQNTKEKVGEALLPVLNQLLTAIMPLVSWLGTLVGNGLGLLSSFLTSTVIPALSHLSPLLQQAGKWFESLFGQVTKGKSPLAALSAQFGPLISTVRQIVPQFLAMGVSIGQHLLPVAQALGNLFTTSILPILEQVAGFVVKQVIPAYLKLEAFLASTLMPILNTLFDVFRTDIVPVLKTLFAQIQTNVLPALEKIWDSVASKLIPALEKLWAKLSPVLIPALQFLGGLLKATLTPILNTVGWILGNVVGPALSGVITIVSDLIDVIATIIGKIGDFLSILGKVKDGIAGAFSGIKNVPVIGGIISHIPGFATGGTMPNTGLALVGENGPELVKLPGGSSVAPIPNPSSLLSGSGVSGLPAGMQPVYGMANGSANGQPLQVNLYLDNVKFGQAVARAVPGAVRHATGARAF